MHSRSRLDCLLFAAILLFCATIARGQTTVTGTISDANGNVYANGTVSAFLLVNTGQPSFSSGPFALNSAGFFSITLNAGSYTFTLCGNPVNIGPLTNPTPKKVCFNTAPIAVSGGLQDISLAANPLALILGPASGKGGSPNSIGPAGFLAVNFNVLADANYSYFVTFTNGSATVTCSDCNFTAADVGKIAFGTNATITGFGSFLSTVVTWPQTAIAGFIDASHVTLSTTFPGTSCTGPGQGCLFVYGHDDTAALQAAWSATATACGTLFLPAGKMLVQKAQFKLIGSNSCTQGVGGSRIGPGIFGYGPNVTQLIPTPNFDPTTCAAQQNICFGDFLDGVQFKNWEVFGAGQSSPGAAFNAMAAIGFNAANNSDFEHVYCIGWGANSLGLGDGIRLNGGQLVMYHIEEDGCGQTGVHVINQTAVESTALTAYDNPVGNVYVNENGSGQGNIFVNSFIGNGGTCDISVKNSAGTSAYTSFINTIVGDNLGTDGSNGFCWGFGPDSSTGNAAGAMIGGFNGFSGRQTGVFVNGAGDTVSLQGMTFVNSASVAYVRAFNAGALVLDQGGNQFLGSSTKFSGSGTVMGAESITGAAVAAGNLVLSAGWGTTAAMSGLSGNTRLVRYTLTASGTGQAANPTITYTYPTSFWVPPVCRITQDGGTQAAVANPFTVGAPTVTSVVFTYTGTPGAGNTVIGTISCDNP